MNYSTIFRNACEIVEKVGDFIEKEHAIFDKRNIDYKGKNDLVSYVDRTAEEMLVEAFSKLIPESTFITEENTIENRQSAFTWIIDPLDGTTNFMHNFAPYAISVALMMDGVLTGGIVYEVSRKEMFYAWKGEGAFLNQKQISVSPAVRLQDALLSTGFPYYNFEKIDQYLSILNELMKHTHGLRRMGSAATDLAYVACGRFEGFFEYNLSPWDVAAGTVLVSEAGGFVSDFKGGNDYVFGKEIVAGCAIHPSLLGVIRKHW
jgi:myo-inositol-1(or 4)-monophosphatase